MQCLRGESHGEIERILLTASGGPFFDREITDSITPEEALRHPTWKMGPKITIGSATPPPPGPASAGRRAMQGAKNLL